MPAALSWRTTSSPGSARPVVTMGTPSSMHVAAHRSVMPRPMGMMLTPNGFARARPDGNNVGPELLVGAAECRQYAETAGFAHGRDQLDTAAALHGALQDRIADAQKIADDGVEHDAALRCCHFAFVPAMRLSEPAMNSCTRDIREARRAKIADHVGLRMRKAKRIAHRLAETPVGRPPRPGALVVGGLADQVHLAAGQQRIVGLPDDASNHLAAVHRQVGRHDGDIAVGRERIAREIARLRLDTIAHAVLGDEFARDLADHGQVEHHGADSGMRLGSRDAVGAGAAADVHDALAARRDRPGARSGGRRPCRSNRWRCDSGARRRP